MPFLFRTRKILLCVVLTASCARGKTMESRTIHSEVFYFVLIFYRVCYSTDQCDTYWDERDKWFYHPMSFRKPRGCLISHISFILSLAANVAGTKSLRSPQPHWHRRNRHTDIWDIALPRLSAHSPNHSTRVASSWVTCLHLQPCSPAVFLTIVFHTLNMKETTNSVSKLHQSFLNNLLLR